MIESGFPKTYSSRRLERCAVLCYILKDVDKGAGRVVGMLRVIVEDITDGDSASTSKVLSGSSSRRGSVCRFPANVLLIALREKDLSHQKLKLRREARDRGYRVPRE